MEPHFLLQLFRDVYTFADDEISFIRFRLKIFISPSFEGIFEVEYENFIILWATLSSFQRAESFGIRTKIINLFETIFFLSRIQAFSFDSLKWPSRLNKGAQRDNFPCTRIIIARGGDIARRFGLLVEPPRPVTRIGRTRERERGRGAEGIELDFETWVETWRKTVPGGRVSRANTVEGTCHKRASWQGGNLETRHCTC